MRVQGSGFRNGSESSEVRGQRLGTARARAGHSFVLSAFRILMSGFCVLAVSGCTEVFIMQRTPTEVSMARALTNAQGETQVGKNGQSPLGQYFESKASSDKVKAGAAAVTDMVGAVASVFSPYAALSSLGGQIMRAIEHYNDCESLRVKVVDTKDRISHYHSTLKYDNLDRPQLEVDVEYAPEAKR